VHAARFRAYSQCLPGYIAALAREAYQRRNAALKAVTTPEQARQRQAWARKVFWDLAGGQPERTPLDLREHGAFARDGYRLRLLSYESRPGLRIPANLYIPTGGSLPFPGVLFQMGHSVNGKAAAPYQRCCQALARLGYVVLAFDPMGQGERIYYRTNDADEEHSRAGRQMLLTGDTATRLQAWDAIRSLDVLAALPEVDPTRLASMGQSGGGTLTMMLAAADPRLACAVVSSGNTENFACAGFNPPGSTDDAEQNLIGSGPLGFDRWDLLYPLAPKPLLLTVSERDSFGTYSPSYLRSGEEEFARLQRIYALLGARSNIEWKTTGLPHALAPEMRMLAYDFLHRHLRGSAAPVSEPPTSPEPDETLVCGVASPRPPRKAPSAGPIDREALRSLLKIGPVPPRAAAVLARDRGAGCAVETWEIESAPGVWLPAYVFLPPAGASPRVLYLILEPGGRTRRWREGELCQALAAAGHAVCAFDVRGIGDLSPEVGRENPHYTVGHAAEEHYTWASMILGRPLLGQRVEDILAMAQAARMRFGGSLPVVLAADAHMTAPALCAAAMGAAWQRVYLSRGLVSWQSLCEVDDYREPFSSFLPGALTKTDLPHIARLIPAGRLTLAGPVDGRRAPMQLDPVRALYGQGVAVEPFEEWGAPLFGRLAASL
jgi:dienelactone hydrolase